MRSLVPKLLAAMIAVLATVVWVPAALAAPAITGTIELGSELSPNSKIIEGPDGNIWVTLEDMEKDVAKITPFGVVEEFDLGPEVFDPEGIVSAEGKLWVPLKTNGVACFSPKTPTAITEFNIAGLGSSAALGLGPDGKIWAGVSEKIFRFAPATPEAFEEIPVPGLAPKDVEAAGPLVAIADGNQEKARIVTFTTGATPSEKDFAINGGSQGVAASPTGQIGFSEQVPKVTGGAEEVGLITPPTPATSIKQPDDPFGAAYGADGAFWIVRAGGAHGLARLSTGGELSLLGGFPAGLTPRQITAGPGNTLWVTDQENMKHGVIVRIGGVEPPPTVIPPVVTPPSSPTPPATAPKPGPDTRLGKAPKKVTRISPGHGAKASVTFTFSSTVAGASFQCGLVKVPTGKGKKKKAPQPSFAGCRSPKVLRLGPGKYRFSVRSVAAGVTDASPATYGFKVLSAPRHR
jgi:streptogramin lyase